ncbi:MAG TPA: helix-turn-helix domain-containing protein [Bacillus sp. (in: firmicutes)]|uniref:winged helix-turn-helix transcriptional regulator n=1 Tax=Bacillus litorisediminis TaxID=2922713 RepID=UPI001FAB8782|nr:helix-turn-helix domain-containing protein [Bacillus litorisediminis]HWO75596.1 helix-turn-helix domain-containing protein [Bacillus sp. (in: firmicutes)]
MEAIPCTIEKALNIIGNKWSFLVLKELYVDKRRFNELLRAINGISPNALTTTLKHLEKNNIVTRTVFPTVPVTVEYELTEKGIAFHKVLKEMKKWGAEWGDK